MHSCTHPEIFVSSAFLMFLSWLCIVYYIQESSMNCSPNVTLTSLRKVLALRDDAMVAGEMPFVSVLSILSKHTAMDFWILNLLSKPTCLIPRFLHSCLRWSRTRVFNSTTLSTWLIWTATDCATSWSSPKCLLFKHCHPETPVLQQHCHPETVLQQHCWWRSS